MEEPSEDGKGLRSRTVMVVLAKRGLRAREREVERPKTPDPIMRMEGGAVNVVEEVIVMCWRHLGEVGSNVNLSIGVQRWNGQHDGVEEERYREVLAKTDNREIRRLLHYLLINMLCLAEKEF